MIEGYDPPTLAPNNHLCMKVSALIGDVLITNTGGSGGCIELDSHVNMRVLGKQSCYILSESRKIGDISPFTESTEGLNQVPIVNTIQSIY